MTSEKENFIEITWNRNEKKIEKSIFFLDIHLE